eukprot:TRINITY_DN9823_c1_g2_i2.p1 TRINITY_DN9823_c1_g2~~TRINITY_DN9823_c1_g2_i2.p1  ORF type:complete len:312 (-),score=34.60 TRINITY_DN9823_c1_g2_i2:146-1012(-)
MGNNFCCVRALGSTALKDNVPRTGEPQSFEIEGAGMCSNHWVVSKKVDSGTFECFHLEHSGNLEKAAGSVTLITSAGAVLEARVSALELKRVDAQQQSWAQWAAGRAGMAWEGSRIVEVFEGGGQVARLQVKCSGLASGNANRLLQAAWLTDKPSSALGEVADDALLGASMACDESRALTKEMNISWTAHGQEAHVDHELRGDNVGNALLESCDDFEVRYQVSSPGVEVVWRNLLSKVVINTTAEADALLACTMGYVLAYLTRQSAESCTRDMMEDMVEIPLVGYALL